MWPQWLSLYPGLVCTPLIWGFLFLPHTGDLLETPLWPCNGKPRPNLRPTAVGLIINIGTCMALFRGSPSGAGLYTSHCG